MGSPVQLTIKGGGGYHYPYCGSILYRSDSEARAALLAAARALVAEAQPRCLGLGASAEARRAYVANRPIALHDRVEVLEWYIPETGRDLPSPPRNGVVTGFMGRMPMVQDDYRTDSHPALLCRRTAADREQHRLRRILSRI